MGILKIRGDTMKRIVEWFKWWWHLKRDLTAISQLKALQAIDAGWHDAGKIIIMFHLDGQDIVKIIDVKRKTTMTDYIKLSKELEQEYGVPPKYFDGLPKGGAFGNFIMKEVNDEAWSL